ncbi:hypothetical protein O181_062350 [Austropuccinia psidii MF-1]|uniref:Uncharacterized protein n=1 Tax=Austropuccinia psidii MF-1 TaxID=1389203 RepID=A0A9Q3EP57_9BASI|nr:hypothetical protein [Austropuccinia psidii MF-1]
MRYHTRFPEAPQTFPSGSDLRKRWTKKWNNERIESYDDSSKLKVKKLTRSNYSEWRWQIGYVFTYKGYHERFNKEWTATNRNTPEYMKRNAYGMSTLYASVSSELHSFLTKHDHFYDAVQALTKVCGETSLITLAEKVYTLLNLTYNPAASLRLHVVTFLSHHNVIKSASVISDTAIDISYSFITIILLRSLKQDSSLSSLVQNLYDVKPFYLERISSHLLMEDSRRGAPNSDALMNIGTTNKHPKPFNQRHDNFYRNGKYFDRSKKPHQN